MLCARGCDCYDATCAGDYCPVKRGSLSGTHALDKKLEAKDASAVRDLMQALMRIPKMTTELCNLYSFCGPLRFKVRVKVV